ncbi:MerR family transcriptional regulator [Naasia lichenicola]|uniref:MerR family transcriptional regulator n=1 Tax=Naasia lichenicola TaxID=2565933 RepID=A0A4S4FF33_9MICO|nr:MerR family transcriptional regulator [Naasia lichenicola]THG28731.1 MerR family transcriptional regulator [Naasia lichenicola]
MLTEQDGSEQDGSDRERPREWSIQQLARLAGTTSRTLRHYQAEGLLEPSRMGANGYRHYDAASLTRLQRILLLRELGLGIAAIRTVLEDQPATVPALRTHLELLRREQERLTRQIASVQHTIRAIDDADTDGEGEQELMPEKMFDGFDHTRYEDEVVQRWGSDAYASSDAWWRAKSPGEQNSFTEAATALIADWRAAAVEGIAPDADEAQTLARRQYDWLSGMPGAPTTAEGRPTREYFVGLADMYPADERFAANYGGIDGATFVRDAMRVFAERSL